MTDTLQETILQNSRSRSVLMTDAAQRDVDAFLRGSSTHIEPIVSIFRALNNFERGMPLIAHEFSKEFRLPLFLVRSGSKENSLTAVIYDDEKNDSYVVLAVMARNDATALNLEKLLGRIASFANVDKLRGDYLER